MIEEFWGFEMAAPSTETYDLLIISPDPKEQEALNSICGEFDYSGIAMRSFEKFRANPIEAGFILISNKATPENSSLAEIVQMVKTLVPSSPIAAIGPANIMKDQAKFIKKSGALITAFDTELFETSKFAFAINQILKASYLPLKLADLVVGTTVPFTIYHLLPQRKKFLPCHFAGDEITTAKLEKLKKINEYYLHRSESLAFKDYIDKTTDISQVGLAKRCRANFLALQTEFTSLVFSLTDQSEFTTHTAGIELFNRIKKITEDLLGNMEGLPDAWTIISGSAIGEFGSLERAPALAAYCGIFGTRLKQKKISETMIIGLLSNLGLIFLPASITEKIRNRIKMDEEETQIYSGFPNRSMKMILDRKIPFDEKSRAHLLGAYERADGNGFPNGISELRLTTESQLIRFAREFDQATLIRMGETRKDPTAMLERIIGSCVPGEKYNQKFTELLEEGFPEYFESEELEEQAS